MADRDPDVLGRVLFSNEFQQGLTPFILEEAAQSSDQTLTAAYVDTPGLSITARDPGLWVVELAAYFLGSGAGDAGADGFAQLLIDGVAHLRLAILAEMYHLVGGNYVHGATVAQRWRHDKRNIGPTIFKIQAKKSGGTGASKLAATHTVLHAFTVPRT